MACFALEPIFSKIDKGIQSASKWNEQDSKQIRPNPWFRMAYTNEHMVNGSLKINHEII